MSSDPDSADPAPGFDDADLALRVDGVSKSYGAVQALDDVSFDLERNAILGLVGDNGAGKSTLLKILNGFIQSDGGEIYLKGEPVSFENPQEAFDAGISMTYQYMALVDNATVWENFFMGRELSTAYGPLKTLRKREMIETVNEQLSQYGVESLDPTDEVQNLTGGEKQILAISRSIASDPEVLMLDEPLTELSRDDRMSVVEFVRNLRERADTSIILVSHDLDIVRDLVDEIMILNKGEKTLSGSPADLSTNEIVDRMV
jgi:ABC-type sugar transport system ATPase subunit